MADQRDAMLREMAKHRGLRLVKSRRRKPGGDFGRYGLTDLETGQDCFGIGENGLEATADEIEDYLRGGARADWKRSLRTAGGAAKQARPEPKSTKAAPPPAPPEPEPEAEAEPQPELRIREAAAGDAAAIAALIGPGDVAKTLRAMIKAGEAPLVADRGGVIGIVAFHAIPSLRDGMIGRITALAVDETERRRGVGTALMAAAEALLTKRGCTVLEAISDIGFGHAHGFFRRMDYARTSYRFAKPQTKS